MKRSRDSTENTHGPTPPRRPEAIRRPSRRAPRTVDGARPQYVAASLVVSKVRSATSRAPLVAVAVGGDGRWLFPAIVSRQTRSPYCLEVTAARALCPRASPEGPTARGFGGVVHDVLRVPNGPPHTIYALANPNPFIGANRCKPKVRRLKAPRQPRKLEVLARCRIDHTSLTAPEPAPLQPVTTRTRPGIQCTPS